MKVMGGRDRDSFEALFDAEWDACVRVSNRIVADRGLAEELAAEAFARAWARWDRLAGGSSPGGWVIRTTVNLAIDHGRRRRLSLRPDRHDRDVGEAVADRVALAAALRSLPRRQRDIVVLRYLDDRSERDVADLLGVSPGTVKTHLHRGLARLRGTLQMEVT